MMTLYFRPMTLNHLRLGHAVTFIKYLASVVCCMKFAESCRAGGKCAYENNFQKK